LCQVMVVDMLEGFTRVGPLASSRVDSLVPRQADFLGSLPAGSLVVFLADAHEPDDREFSRFPPHCVRGTREAEVREELLEAARVSRSRIEIVRKATFSGFFETRLGEIVSSARSDSWIVIGCVTDCCVEANVAELVYRGRRVTVVRSLVDTWDMTSQQAAEAGLPGWCEHPADAINDEWFSRRLPGIWGATVVDDWRELGGLSRGWGVGVEA
jgi:nicotinamidase/pyrazinamidase